MYNVDVERKLVVIQEYLVKNFPQYAVRCDDRASGEPVFVLISSGAVHVGSESAQLCSPTSDGNGVGVGVTG
jgi:hypothetical protein